MSPEAILFRQVHPDFAPGGQLTSQAFMPFPRDDGKLSVYDGDQISAAESHAHYTGSLEYKSAGVWGVTCAETAGLGLPSISNPLEGFPSHALIDFTSHRPKDFRKLAKRLKAITVARGCLYVPAHS